MTIKDAAILVALSLLIVLAGYAFAGDLPDPAMTPGLADPALSSQKLCSRQFTTRSIRNVSESTKRQVFKNYGIPWECHSFFEVDHLVSLELGGSNDIENLWPQPFVCVPDAKKSQEQSEALGDISVSPNTRSRDIGVRRQKRARQIAKGGSGGIIRTKPPIGSNTTNIAGRDVSGIQNIEKSCSSSHASNIVGTAPRLFPTAENTVSGSDSALASNSTKQCRSPNLASALYASALSQTGIDSLSIIATKPISSVDYSATTAIRALASSATTRTDSKKPPNICAAFLSCTLNAREKDKLENRLHKEVCEGNITLQDAQTAISGDWRESFKKYFGEP